MPHIFNGEPRRASKRWTLADATPGRRAAVATVPVRGKQHKEQRHIIRRVVVDLAAEVSVVLPHKDPYVPHRSK